ncbi:MAG: CCA tRNA nucleotidyltransferase [Candidatus Omnitrophica bacterium]|nr:CCA tRNA nucleotidyltransferase [Candidatus Omnitrophota bacterium]
MKKYLNNLPEEVKDLMRLAGKVASQNNMPAYLVGGFVRDLLLGLPNLDLDIVVEGDGVKFAQDFAHRLKAKITCHRQFGTATINLGRNLKIDIASARCEYYPEAAHLPVVRPGNLKDDLKRRDFTINTIAISINQKDRGRLIDFFHGKEDLHHKKIRILHDLSFIDDPTRIFRAIRFEQRFNFKIEPNTLKCLSQALAQEMLTKVQPQRIRDEIILILKEDRPIRLIKRMEQLISFKFVHPRLYISENIHRFLESIQRQIKWFKKNYPERRPLDVWLVYFMGLLEHLKLSQVKVICARFAFRRGETKRILNYKKLKARFILNLKKKKIKPSQIFQKLEPLSYEVIIIIKAKFKDKLIHKRIADFFEIYNGMRIVISGADLQRLGVSPGPYYQKIFSQVLNAKLNGRLRSREEELALIKKLIRNK